MKVYGAETGRFSSSRPNKANTPKERGVYIPPLSEYQVDMMHRLIDSPEGHLGVFREPPEDMREKDRMLVQNCISQIEALKRLGLVEEIVDWVDEFQTSQFQFIQATEKGRLLFNERPGVKPTVQ